MRGLRPDANNRGYFGLPRQTIGNHLIPGSDPLTPQGRGQILHRLNPRRNGMELVMDVGMAVTGDEAIITMSIQIQ